MKGDFRHLTLSPFFYTIGAISRCRKDIARTIWEGAARIPDGRRVFKLNGAYLSHYTTYAKGV